MGWFSDVFGGQGSQDAAQAQISGLNTAYNTTKPFFKQARGDISTGATQSIGALAPYTGTAGAGAGQLSNILGLSGDPAQALRTLQGLPGYQFALQSGEQGVDRGAAARTGGSLYSGNTLNAEQQFGQNLGYGQYFNLANQLQPFLGAQGQAGALNAGIYTGQGQNLANIGLNQGNLNYNTQLGIGNANAAADLARQATETSLVKGIANLGGTLLGFGMGGGFPMGA